MPRDEQDQVDGLRAGIYQHYKGAYYLVLGIASMSDNGFLKRLATEGDVYYVVYVSLTPQIGDLSRPKMHIRRLSEFTENVEWPLGHSDPRFRFVGFQP